MAYINISVSEVLKFADKNLNYDKERIKSIKLINESQIEITVSIGKMFPNMKVTLSYNGFREGKLHFNILTNGGIRILMGLLNEFGSPKLNDYIKLEKAVVEFSISKLLSDNIQGIEIRDINMNGEQIYVTVDFK